MSDERLAQYLNNAITQLDDLQSRVDDLIVGSKSTYKSKREKMLDDMIFEAYGVSDASGYLARGLDTLKQRIGPSDGLVSKNKAFSDDQRKKVESVMSAINRFLRDTEEDELMVDEFMQLVNRLEDITGQKFKAHQPDTITLTELRKQMGPDPFFGDMNVPRSAATK